MALSRAIIDAPGINDRLETTGDIEKIDAKAAELRAWEAVKRAVAERDEYHCRMCGKACRYGDPIETKADPHHIILESLGGPSTTANVIYLCRRCHSLCHKAKRFWLSGNADERDPLGHGMVKVEKQTESGFDVVGFI